MEELADGLFRPILKLILGFLRVLQFLAWDLLFSYIGWSIGWCFYRIISFGKYPNEGIGDLDSCHWGKALFVEFTGLAILGVSIVLISGAL